MTGPTWPGTLTVLRTTGTALATKVWRWHPALGEWSKRSYQAGRLFRPAEYPIASLHDLAVLLERVSRDQRAFVVRGGLAPWVQEELAQNPHLLIRRLKLKKDGVDPTLIEVPCPWLMVDIDNFPLRPSDDLADDPEFAIAHAVGELLPPEFHDVEALWQLSSSAGFVTDVLKAHVVFWLSEPESNEHIKAVLGQHAPRLTDLSFFNAAQPHYIAAPVIVGAPDPLPRRTGRLKGANANVTLPLLRHAAPRQRTQSRSYNPEGGVEDALARLGDGDGLCGFHEPLRTATMHYATRCARFGVRADNDDAFIDTLRSVVSAAPRRADRANVDEYLSGDYLQRLLDGAFALVAGGQSTAEIAAAQCLWNRTTAPDGTAADHYLSGTQGIPRPADGWPKAVRFLAAPPGNNAVGALVLAATLTDGTVRGALCIYLTASAENLRRSDGSKVERSLGVLDDTAVRLPGPPEGPLLLAAGAECGLSVWIATGHETWVALGRVADHRPPIGRRVVLCRDDDKTHSPADKALARAVAAWREDGVDLVVAKPWPARQGDQSSFSDLLKAGGAAAVQGRIAIALCPGHDQPPQQRVPVTEARRLRDAAVDQFFTAAVEYHDKLGQAKAEEKAAEEARAEPKVPREIKLARGAKAEAHAAAEALARAMAEPRQAAQTGTQARAAAKQAAAARKAARAAVKAARARARQTATDAAAFRNEARKIQRDIDKAAAEAAKAKVGPPPVHAVKIDFGTGKSQAMRRAVARLLRQMREHNDNRTVVIFVPTHELSQEQAKLFETEPDAIAAGLRAAIWRGREAEDPDAPGNPMCQDLDAIADALYAVTDPQTAVCRRVESDIVAECRFFPECSYQRQRAVEADVWFAAHEMLFSEKPAALGEAAVCHGGVGGGGHRTGRLRWSCDTSTMAWSGSDDRGEIGAVRASGEVR